MAENQPPNVVEGATTGDIDEEVPIAAKSAEDRKAAAALSSLDAPREDESAGRDVDQEAVRKAMDRLAGSSGANGTAAKKNDEKKVVKKAVKVDPADVTLLVCVLRHSLGMAMHSCHPSLRSTTNSPALASTTTRLSLPSQHIKHSTAYYSRNPSLTEATPG
jgi:hypothetical protein